MEIEPTKGKKRKIAEAEITITEPPPSKKQKTIQKEPKTVEAPIGSVIDYHLLSPNTTELVINHLYGAEIDFKKLLDEEIDYSYYTNIPVSVDALGLDIELRDKVIGDMKQNLLKKNKEVVSEPNVPINYVNAVQVDNDVINIEYNSENNKEMIDEIEEARKMNQQLEIVPTTNQPYLTLTNAPIIRTVNVQDGPVIIDDDVQTGDVLEVDESQPSSMDVVNSIPKGSVSIEDVEKNNQSLKNLINNGTVKIVNPQNLPVNNVLPKKTKKKKKNTFTDRTARRLLGDLQTDPEEVTVGRFTLVPKRIDKKPPTSVDVADTENFFSSEGIRSSLHKYGIRCSLKMASKIRRYNILTKISIFKLATLTYLMQKHRYNMNKQEEYIRSHPTVTKRILILVTVLFMKDDARDVLSGLQNIVIGQPTRDHADVNKKNRKTTKLGKKKTGIPIENFFTFYDIKQPQQ